MKKGILIVSYGTADIKTFKDTIGMLEKDIRRAWRQYDVYHAFTSRVMRQKLLKAKGIAIPSVKEALEQMKKDGVRQVMLQPTHVIKGGDYHKLAEEGEQARDMFDTFRMGKPLLSDIGDHIKAVNAVTESVNIEADEALVMVGHGTDSSADAVYELLEQTFHAKGYKNVAVGTVMGRPDFEDVVKKLRAMNKKEVLLMPFLLTAGAHARQDIAGDETSWKQRLAEEGFDVTVNIRGLGEQPEIRLIYMEHLKEIIEQEM